ncbi:elongation factor TS-domain-containing protein [Hyaloraphidium curvatum]|nr:elongation factor TS-domain-containing protein [Hyaloraphidium curvatum]
MPRFPVLSRLRSSLPRCSVPAAARALSATPRALQKADMKLLAQLRKDTQISMSKAKEALLATNNDYAAALAWLEKDAAVSGAAKASKLAGRDANDGLVGIVIGSAGLGGAIVEMNTETDFVARNPIFSSLVTQVGATTLFLHSVGGTTAGDRVLQEVNAEEVLASPLMPHPTAEMDGDAAPETIKTVSERIAEVVGKVGENIKLRRVAVAGGRVEGDVLQLTGGYVHSTSSDGAPLQGRIGALVVVDAKGKAAVVHRKKVAQLAKNLAQHIVGFAPKYAVEDDVDRTAIPDEVQQHVGEDPAAMDRYLDEVVLARQPFFLGGGTVAEILARTSEELGVRVGVNGFVRWGVAEE